MEPLKWLGLWTLGVHFHHQRLRTMYYKKAVEKGAQYGKPVLVVGNPKGKHGCGDVMLDVAPSGTCPREVQSEVQSMPMFQDNEFGAIFVGHVIEHLPLGEAQQAVAELTRIGEYVVILYPSTFSVLGTFVPDHKTETLAWLRKLSRSGVLEWED